MGFEHKSPAESDPNTGQECRVLDPISHFEEFVPHRPGTTGIQTITVMVRQKFERLEKSGIVAEFFAQVFCATKCLLINEPVNRDDLGSFQEVEAQRTLQSVASTVF